MIQRCVFVHAVCFLSLLVRFLPTQENTLCFTHPLGLYEALHTTVYGTSLLRLQILQIHIVYSYETQYCSVFRRNALVQHVEIYSI